MCRWLAYTGSQTVLIEELLYKPEHSLVVQSMHSTMGAEPTNGDGFGIGWYGAQDTPGTFYSVEPAWNDRNLRNLAAHISSRCIFAHIRASSGSPVQLTNCHPFRHGRWLWMHNGLISNFHVLKRDLTLAVDPMLFPLIEGSTDSELLFYLALTCDLDNDPVGAVARAIGLVEEVGHRRGEPFPMQGSIAATDGQSLYAFRYSSEGRSRTLYHSADVSTLRHQYPDNPVLHELSEDARIVVSEPLSDLRGAWREVPEGTCVVIAEGHEELRPFAPVAAAPMWSSATSGAGVGSAP